MATTTRDFVTPDTLARASRSLEAISDSELLGEKLTINVGPSHPATHGVLRIVLELDGEIITKADPDVGYLHRGDEKIAENMQYNQFVPYTDRLDYLAPLANNVAYALAVEKLMGWELPPRGKAIRVICCEKLYNRFELLTGARFTTSYTRVGGQIRDLPPTFIPALCKFLDEFVPQL